MSVTNALASQEASNLETMLSVFGPASTASFVSACALMIPGRLGRLLIVIFQRRSDASKALQRCAESRWTGLSRPWHLETGHHAA